MKRGFPVSIPVKVVLITGTAYLLLWVAGALATLTGLVDFSQVVYGFTVQQIWWAIQIVSLATLATLSTHFFLDRPLKQLAQAMSKAEDGDFLIRAPVTSSDEIGELAESFNTMLAKLTDLSANKIQTEHDLIVAQEELKYRSSLDEKSRIITKTNKNLEHLVKDLSLIYEIGQEVNSVVDLNDLYEHITKTLKHHLSIKQFAVLAFDDNNKQEMHVKSASGFKDNDHVLRTTFRKGEGISGLVAQTGKKIYIRDTSADKRFLKYKQDELTERSSFLSIPLMYKGEVYGVINFGRPGASGFSLTDVKMLTLVANQVALAIANAKLHTKTRELSVTDELTGVHNRRHFQQMLQMEWKRAVRFERELSVVMLDIDHFKEYNDTYLHLEGDRVLKRIGRILKDNLREVDTVARFGGEEFVLLLPSTDKAGAVAAAEKVRQFLEKERFVTEKGEPTRPVTISCGIAMYPSDVQTIEDLIDHADIALYKAKSEGRNRVATFTPEDDDQSPKSVKSKREAKKKEVIEGPKTLQ